MIELLERLPNLRLLAEFERACPAEMALLEGEAPLLGHGICALWRQRLGERTTALLLRTTTGGVVLAPLAGADLAELAEFLPVVGFGSVTLPGQWAKALALPQTAWERCLVMEFRGPLPPVALGLELRPLSTDRLLANTLAAFGPVVPAEGREEWQWAFGLRQRRGAALALGLWRGDVLLSAAALSHIGKAAALVGFVGTPPAHRGRGYARQLAAILAAQALELGRRPLLCCKPELEALYRAAGFCPIGTQAVARPISP